MNKETFSPTTSHAIIVVGIPGAGKTAFAEHFSSTFKAPLVNFELFKRKLGLDDKKAEVLRTLLLAEFTKLPGTIIIDGGTERKSVRAQLVRTVTKAGYTPLIVWVQTDPIEAKRRALKKYPQGLGLSSTEFDASVHDFQAPSTAEKAIVISGRHTYATQLKVVLRQLAVGNRPSTSPIPVRQPRSDTNRAIL